MLKVAKYYHDNRNAISNNIKKEEAVTGVSSILISFLLLLKHGRFEWAFIVSSNEIMWAAYLHFFFGRSGIMGLLKLYNCNLLFPSFTFLFLLCLIPNPPLQRIVPFFPTLLRFYLRTVKSIFFHYANQFNFSQNRESVIEGDLVRRKNEFRKKEENRTKCIRPEMLDSTGSNFERLNIAFHPSIWSCCFIFFPSRSAPSWFKATPVLPQNNCSLCPVSAGERRMEL